MSLTQPGDYTGARRTNCRYSRALENCLHDEQSVVLIKRSLHLFALHVAQFRYGIGLVVGVGRRGRRDERLERAPDELRQGESARLRHSPRRDQVPDRRSRLHLRFLHLLRRGATGACGRLGHGIRSLRPDARRENGRGRYDGARARAARVFLAPVEQTAGRRDSGGGLAAVRRLLGRIPPRFVPALMLRIRMRLLAARTERRQARGSVAPRAGQGRLAIRWMIGDHVAVAVPPALHPVVVMGARAVLARGRLASGQRVGHLAASVSRLVTLLVPFQWAERTNTHKYALGRYSLCAS